MVGTVLVFAEGRGLRPGGWGPQMGFREGLLVPKVILFLGLSCQVASSGDQGLWGRIRSLLVTVSKYCSQPLGPGLLAPKGNLSHGIEFHFL